MLSLFYHAVNWVRPFQNVMKICSHTKLLSSFSNTCAIKASASNTTVVVSSIILNILHPLHRTATGFYRQQLQAFLQKVFFQFVSVIIFSPALAFPQQSYYPQHILNQCVHWVTILSITWFVMSASYLLTNATCAKSFTEPTW